MTLRSHRKDRSSWSLVGLAVRIAHGLGLHKDGDGQAFHPFEAEMRRRVWWQILVLDMRASEDRGSEPVITDGSFNTRMPCNLNDEDIIGSTGREPLAEKKGVTDMTFALISMDVSNTRRKINFIPATNGRQNLTFEEREELVKQCTDRIEKTYLAGCDPTDERSRMLSMIGRLLILQQWLVLQYPLQSGSSPSRGFTRSQTLRTVVTVLEMTELIENSDTAAGFVWYFNTYVPWHTLAVGLTELCTDTQGPLADKAWKIIEKGYDKWSERVADGKDGMLWRPVKHLLKRAQAARQRAQKPMVAKHAYEPSTLHGIPGSYQVERISSMTNPTLGVSQGNPLDLMALGDLGLLDYTAYQPFEFDAYTSLDTIPPNAETYQAPVNWDDWNQFILDASAAGTNIPPSTSLECPMQM